MLLKVLNSEILKKTNFAHSVSHPLGEKKFADPKRQSLLILWAARLTSFDKEGSFWKPWSSKSLKTRILFILWATGVVKKYIESSFRDVKLVHTYIIPLNATPWWRFFFEIWQSGILIDRILVASQHLSYMHSSIQSKYSIGRENNLKKQSMKTYKHISPRVTNKAKHSITT